MGDARAESNRQGAPPPQSPRFQALSWWISQRCDPITPMSSFHPTAVGPSSTDRNAGKVSPGRCTHLLHHVYDFTSKASERILCFTA
jgi:hypothetical protein